MVTLDHIIAKRDLERGYKGQTTALTLIDRATNFRWGRGLQDKGGKSCSEVMRRFQGTFGEDKINYVYSDNAPEDSYAIRAW
jgi:hypothetical protein